MTFTPGTGNTSFTATATPQGGGTAVTGTGTGSPIALTGLAPNTTYGLSLQAVCSGGGTTPAVTITITTRSVSVCFTPRSTKWWPDSVSSTGGGTSVSATGSASPITLTGLTPGTTYSVTVTGTCTAAAGGGTSPASAAASFSTSPAALQNLVVSNTQTISGSYNNVTITGPTTGGAGVATLGGTLNVAGTLTVQAGGALLQNCQALVGSGSFVLQAGASLAICDPAGIATTGAVGAVQVTGSRSFSPDASYAYNGTVAQVTGSGLPGRVFNLGVANPQGLTLSQAVSITQVLRLDAGNLTTGGQMLTLLSSAAGTALVDNRGGLVVGTATVQRYIDPSRNAGLGYRHYSAPVANTTISDLAASGYTPVVNPLYNTAGNTVKPFPNVFGYDETRVNPSVVSGAPSPSPDFDKGFFSPNTTGDALEVTRGYTVNISPTALVDFVGTLNSGDLPKAPVALTRGNQTQSGWHLRGNPYPSPLDWNLMRSNGRLTNLEDGLYVFKSSGQYTGSYASYVNGLGTNGGTNVLPLAQGFFVRTVAGQTGSIRFTNQERVTTFDATPFQRSTADSRPQLTLALSSATARTQTIVYFEQGATAGFDKAFDAHALPAPNGLTLATETPASEPLAINGQPALKGADVLLPLRVAATAAGTYSLNVDHLANLPSGYHAYLRDALTGSYADLANSPSLTLTLAANGSASSRYAVLFSTEARVLASAPAALAQLASVYPNPAHGTATLLLPLALRGNQATAVSVVDNVGRVVLTRTLAVGAAETLELPLASLSSGVYTVLARTSAGLVAKRLVVE
ncbi:MAG: hypothetical protein NVS3B25_31000 [Hymenobacter sp.]